MINLSKIKCVAGTIDKSGKIKAISSKVLDTAIKKSRVKAEDKEKSKVRGE